LKKVIVVKRTANFVDMDPERDYWWHDLMNDSDIETYCEPEQMDAEDPLFILYTSGSTGKPKGVLHTTGGYMVYTNITFKLAFDYKPEETFFAPLILAG